MSTAKSASPMISMIALVSENGAVAGPVHSIAWRAPWLANRTLQVTRGRPVVLGRKAFHYMNMLAADRWLFVVTRDEELLEAGGNMHLSGFGFWYMSGVDQAIDAATSLARSKGAPEVFIAGGASLYEQALSRTRRLYRTVLHERLADAPKLGPDTFAGWREVHAERRTKGSNGIPDQTYSVIERAG